MSNLRRIVITGVSRGLGRAMVDQFIARGHQVIGCARSAEAVEQLAAQYGAPHRFDALDVARCDEVEKWAQSVLADGGPPDLLINNAGKINTNAVLWQVPIEEFSTVVDINLKGMFYVLRYFIPAMIERRLGIIVNLSSEWGRSTSPEVAPYCATKWGTEGLTKALARELPRGMAAVAVSPGIVHTEMLESCFGTAAANFPSPEKWADSAVPFLLQIGVKDNGASLTTPN